jgi:antitoxin component YwqK of YwqJK toxin-antitoxin module
MNKFIDYFSPEKGIIKEKFNTIPYMDIWISSIVEGYIYEKVSKVNEYSGTKEEYIERYGKKEGEYKMWHPNGKIKRQGYYKDDKLEGEYKRWYDNGQLGGQSYYKEGKKEGETKSWDKCGNLTEHKLYTGDVIKDFLKD